MANDESASESEQFEFKTGDTVCVRVREDGTSGNIVAKFEAECTQINTEKAIGASESARFELPFGVFNSVTVRHNEAEFEVVE
jgi:hypothetical protein